MDNYGLQPGIHTVDDKVTLSSNNSTFFSFYIIIVSVFESIKQH